MSTSDPIPFAVPSIDERDIDAVVGVLRSRWLTTGEQARLFEQELAEYLRIEHVSAVASCTHALQICLAFLGLPPGARVGVPTWTFVSTALSVVHAGLTPVLLDIDEKTLNLDPSSLEDAVATLDAVIPVHFGGVAVSDDVYSICNHASIPVIEDAAHAIGTRYEDDTPVNGSRSLAACFSFYATKNLTSGEGGAIATRDRSLSEFAESYRLHGMTNSAWARYMPDGKPLYDLDGPGIKANFPDILAALARTQLARFNEMQAKRRWAVIHYRQRLAGMSDLQLVPDNHPDGSADHLMVVLLPHGVDRSHILESLRDQGVSTSVHFRPLHRFTWMVDNALAGPSGFPTADSLCDRALSLPLYPDLTETQIDRVCMALETALDRRADIA